jgi:DNA-binding NarL/FixJ family response regulator
MKPTQDELTVQEDLIVAWRAMGLCHKQIAALLHRSEKVVSWHLGNVNRKLGYNDASRLTHWAISRKLVKLNETV